MGRDRGYAIHLAIKVGGDPLYLLMNGGAQIRDGREAEQVVVIIDTCTLKYSHFDTPCLSPKTTTGKLLNITCEHLSTFWCEV